MTKKNYLTVSEMIKELERIPMEYRDCEVTSIGSWSGWDRPCDYTLTIYKESAAEGNYHHFNLGKRKE